MTKFRMFMTVFFLFSALIIILLIAVLDSATLLRAVDLIKSYLWLAALALIFFLSFLSAGVVTNHAEIEGSLIGNGYFQVAILELFLFSAALGYFWYYSQQPAKFVFQLQREAERNIVYLAVKYQSDESTKADTIKAPGTMENLPAGRYSIETTDSDIVPYHTDVELKPGEIETLKIPVVLNVKTLAVQTEPEGADIWLNGVQASKTPSTFNVITGDTVILELKLTGYQVYSDTLSLHEDVNLGIIPLHKLFTVWISSKYEDVAYRIYDVDNKVVFASYGSRKVQLAQGRYRISWEIGEGQYESKRFSLNYNATVMIP